LSSAAQEIWTIADLDRECRARRCVAWVSPSVRDSVARRLPALQVVPALSPPPAQAEYLVVIGGGTLIDEAKAFVADHRGAPLALVAVPSIWGSGAEASPVCVLQRDGKKCIRVEERFVPYARAVWPELATTIPVERARMACGDVWAHALEGFLSPLARHELRRELSALMQEMLRLPLGNDPAWFELSAQACAAQARSSVGLVHGIAHTLEEKGCGGHACLCATYLLPVMRFNLEASAKAQALFAEFGVDREAVLRALGALHDPETYRRSLPVLSENWNSVLRDPSTRTNCALVRPQHLDHFTRFAAA
jgi:hypothetical protein